jgi:hypothetical protein
MSNAHLTNSGAHVRVGTGPRNLVATFGSIGGGNGDADRIIVMEYGQDFLEACRPARWKTCKARREFVSAPRSAESIQPKFISLLRDRTCATRPAS